MIQQHKQSVAVCAMESKTGMVGQAQGRVTGQLALGDLFQDASDQVVAQGYGPCLSVPGDSQQPAEMLLPCRQYRGYCACQPSARTPGCLRFELGVIGVPWRTYKAPTPLGP